MIVAIDGPAGAGKSTVARRLARALGATYLNTGAMYRAVALLARRHGVDVGDGAAVTALARRHRILLEPAEDGERVIVDGEDVSDAVRTPEVTGVVSVVAAHAALRDVIVDEQRRIIATGDWVADGRDIGTVVAPNAEVKIFLTADATVRARRRWDELVRGGADVALGDVLQDITDRDETDRTRAASPLTVAPGAHVVDSTGRDVDEVVAHLLTIVSQEEGRSV